MKLIKVYSPFLLLLFAMLLSCRSGEDDYKQALSIYNKKLKAVELSHRAERYFKDKVYDSAFSLYNASKKIYSSVKDSTGVGHSLINMAHIQRYSGDYSGSEESATEALDFINPKSDSAYMSAAYNSLGITYNKQYNYKQALAYYNQSFSVAKDSNARCILYNNIASVYIEQARYKEALAILLKLGASDTVKKDVETLARVYNNIGKAYTITKHPQALAYLDMGLKLRQASNSKNVQSSHYNIANYYAVNNNIPLSNSHALKAYNIATDIANTEERLDALQMIVGNKSAISYKYLPKFLSLNDSLKKARVMAKNYFTKIKYDSKVANDSVLLYKVKHANDQLKIEERNGMVIVAISIVAVLALLFAIFRIIHKKEKIQEAYKTETRIAKTIHDELANDMFKMMAFAENLPVGNAHQKERLVDGLDRVYQRTRDISRENNSIATNKDFAKGLKHMLDDFNRDNVSIMMVNCDDIAWEAVEVHKKITLYRVLQELLVNMKKHSKASLVVIKFIKHEKNLTVEYTDNGVGLQQEIIYKNGLQNAESRILNINGNIKFDSKPGKGLKVNLDFPI